MPIADGGTGATSVAGAVAALGFLVSAASHSDGLTQIYAKYWGLNDKDAVGPFRVNWVVVYS